MKRVTGSFTDAHWAALVTARRPHIARFLSWAKGHESVDSMRLANRRDISRLRQVVPAFADPRWGAVVYSCFDSVTGALAGAHVFREPLHPDEAARQLAEMKLPTGAVGGHRTQPGHKGAKDALLSACEHWPAFEDVLTRPRSFHDRYLRLRSMRARQWGRTTCYDLLVRAGQLGIEAAARYEPDRAYLADSTGPRKGFQLIWGIEVTAANAGDCEALLRLWTARWEMVAEHAGVHWSGAPYGPGDFENALCIYQERGNPGYGVGVDPSPVTGEARRPRAMRGERTC